MTGRHWRFALCTMLFSVVPALLWAQSGGGGGNEPYRPAYHFTPNKNWINDPNGLVYLDGEYHLFTQYNPFGSDWGHMSWGHSVSRDLLHWKELPVALAEEKSIMIFSGSAVVDLANSSGFGRGGRPPLVAIYTGARTKNQHQSIAFSTDGGRTFQKFAGNPVLDLGLAEFRDPMVFRHEPTHRWVMVVSLAEAHKVRFYNSPDLKTWTYMSEFGPAGASPVKNWECPNFFELPVSGGPTRKYVLELGVGEGTPAGGSGSEYFVGDFDGHAFKNANPQAKTLWVDYGADYYAAQTWSNIPPSDGRRIILGWMSNWNYAAKVPTKPWRGQMSIPRELSLKHGKDGIRLVQAPVRELQQLRAKHFTVREQSLAAANAALTKLDLGDSLEILAHFSLGQASDIGLHLRKGASQQTSVGYDGERKTLYIDRAQSGEVAFSSLFGGRQQGPLSVEDGNVTLHIFLDRCSVEVFGNGGGTVLTDLIFPKTSGRGLDLYSVGGPARDVSLDIWTLNDTR